MKIVIEATTQEIRELGIIQTHGLRGQLSPDLAQTTRPDDLPDPHKTEHQRIHDEAVVACAEAGCAGMDPAATIRHLCEQLTQAKSAPTEPLRSDDEIVAQTEELAAMLLAWRWEQQPESPDTQFRHSLNARAQNCWSAACRIQDMLTGTDAENAADVVDDATGARAKSQDTPRS